MSIHLILLTLSCGALAAAAACGQLTGLSGDALRARQMALLICGALVVGNGVCLLPDTPSWYSAALIALTFGGLVWLAVSSVAASRAARRRPTRVVATTYDRRGSVAATPRLSVVSATPVEQLEPCSSAPPALAVLPGRRSHDAPYPVVTATPTHPLGEGVTWDAAVLSHYLAERGVVTRRELDAIGSPGARAQNVGVARRLGASAPEAARRRAAGSAFRARAHAADGSVLRGQVQAAYDDAAPAPRGRGTRA